MVYCSTIAFDFCLLIVWIGLYNAFKSSTDYDNSGERKKYSYCYYASIKFICIFLMFLAYPVQICFSYFNSSRETSTQHLNFILYIMIILNIIVVFFTLIYTIHLRVRIKKGYMNNYKEKTLDVKIIHNRSGGNNFSSNTNINILNPNTSHQNMSIRQPNTLEPISINKVSEVKYFLKEIYQKKLINVVDKYILDHNDPNDENTQNNYDIINYSIDFQKEMTYLDEPVVPLQSQDNSHRRNSHDVNALNFESNRMNEESFPIKNQPNSLTNAPIHKKNEEKNSGITEFTETDIKNLDNIFYLSYFIIFSQVVVFIIVICTNFEILINRSGVAITALVIEFIFELSGFYALCRLFVQDLKNQEYINLRIIAEIEKYQNKEKEEGGGSILKFDFIKQQHIKQRFKSFLTLYGENYQD